MAKRDSMSKARRSRNLKDETATEAETVAAAASDREPVDTLTPPSDPAQLAEVISDERMQLMKAQAVLGCVAFALLYEDWLEGEDRPSFVLAVEVAQDLVSRSIERLGANH